MKSINSCVKHLHVDHTEAFLKGASSNVGKVRWSRSVSPNFAEALVLDTYLF